MSKKSRPEVKINAVKTAFPEAICKSAACYPEYSDSHTLTMLRIANKVLSKHLLLCTFIPFWDCQVPTVLELCLYFCAVGTMPVT